MKIFDYGDERLALGDGRERRSRSGEPASSLAAGAGRRARRLEQLRKLGGAERFRDRDHRSVGDIAEFRTRGIRATNPLASSNVEHFTNESRFSNPRAALHEQCASMPLAHAKDALDQKFQFDRPADELSANDARSDHVAGGFYETSYSSCMNMLGWSHAPEDEEVKDEETNPQPGGGTNPQPGGGTNPQPGGGGH